MNKKTPNVNRKVVPFGGPLDTLKTLIAGQVGLCHCTPQRRGKLKGRSPDDAYGEAIKVGWQMTAVEAEAFRLAFSFERQLTVRQGAISIGGNRWSCPELVRWQEPKITALIAKYDDWDSIPLLDRDRSYVGSAVRQRSYAPDDPAGAIEAKNIQDQHIQAVIELARSAPDVDPVQKRMQFLQAQPPSPVAPIGQYIAASDDAKRILVELDKARETPAQRKAREKQEHETRVQQNLDAGAAVLAGLRRNMQR